MLALAYPFATPSIQYYSENKLYAQQLPNTSFHAAKRKVFPNHLFEDDMVSFPKIMLSAKHEEKFDNKDIERSEGFINICYARSTGVIYL